MTSDAFSEPFVAPLGNGPAGAAAEEEDNRILLESGDSLLQQTGDALLLES